jgi:hypothetical protein
MTDKTTMTSKRQSLLNKHRNNDRRLPNSKERHLGALLQRHVLVGSYHGLSRPEYMVFALDIFRQRVYQEVPLPKYWNYLEDKRKKKEEKNPSTGTVTIINSV